MPTTTQSACALSSAVELSLVHLKEPLFLANISQLSWSTPKYSLRGEENISLFITYKIAIE
jgi:hypothetical protein